MEVYYKAYRADAATMHAQLVNISELVPLRPIHNNILQ